MAAHILGENSPIRYEETPGSPIFSSSPPLVCLPSQSSGRAPAGSLKMSEVMRGHCRRPRRPAPPCESIQSFRDLFLQCWLLDRPAKAAQAGVPVPHGPQRFFCAGEGDCGPRFQLISTQAAASHKVVETPRVSIVGRDFFGVLRSSLVSLEISPRGSDARRTAQLRLTLASAPPLGFAQDCGRFKGSGTKKH